MFGIGLFELVLIVVAALIFVGPSKLPEVARQFGRFFVQVRRMTTDVRRTVDTAIQDAEHQLLSEEREKVSKFLEETQKKVREETDNLTNIDTTPHDSEPSS